MNLGAGTASGFASIANIENVATGSGNDQLVDAAGVNNTLAGGAGNDNYTVHETADAVNEAAGGGTDSVLSFAANYTLSANVENLTYAGGGNFTGTGNVIANVITGGAGNDVLSGAAGNDVLNGLGGSDTLNGGAGNDTIDAGEGDDIVNYTIGDGADTVAGGGGSDRLNITGTAGANTLGVVFNGTALTSVAGGSVTGVESFVADLLAGNDTLNYTGTSVAVTVNLGAGTASGFTSIANIENVTGGSGNDQLVDAAGTNTLAGGAGDDTYTVHEAADNVTEGAGAGTDLVLSFANSYNLSANVDNLTFVGSGSFTGAGNAQANTIIGGAGDDSLISGGGADTLRGGLGNDTMDGGAADDIFVFEPGFGNDRITGFDANPAGGQDRLDIHLLGITDFANQVTITTGELDLIAGLDTLVTIGLDHITLAGVNGAGPNTVTVADFILA